MFHICRVVLHIKYLSIALHNMPYCDRLSRFQFYCILYHIVTCHVSICGIAHCVMLALNLNVPYLFTITCSYISFQHILPYCHTMWMFLGYYCTYCSMSHHVIAYCVILSQKVNVPYLLRCATFHVIAYHAILSQNVNVPHIFIYDPVTYHIFHFVAHCVILSQKVYVPNVSHIVLSISVRLDHALAPAFWSRPCM